MKQLGTLVFLGLLGSAAPAAAADDIVIQWRAWKDPVTDCTTPWPTCYQVRNGVQYKKEDSLSNVSDSYGRRFYKFDGVNDYIYLGERANADEDDGLTVRAWFRPDRVSGRQVVISNTRSAGFSLQLDGDRVTGKVNIAGAYYSVTSTTAVSLGKWNQATFVVDLDGDDMESSHIDGGPNRARLELWVNGKKTEAKFPLGPLGTNPEIVNSPTNPLVGAEPNASGAPTGGFFKGDIEAVNVRNYPIESDSFHPDAKLGANDWLSMPPPEDGSIKGGEPSYYDVKLEAASLTVDARFADPGPPELEAKDEDTYDSTRIQIHSLVPFMNDEYVVQGIASTCPTTTSCANERLFLSLYWHGEGQTKNPSLIVEIDPKKNSGGRVLSCRKLTGALGESHVAGLGYFAEMLYVGGTDTNGQAQAERYEIWNQGSDAKCTDLAPVGIDPIFDAGSLSIQQTADDPPQGFLLVSDYWSQGEDDFAEIACEDYHLGACLSGYHGVCEDAVDCALACDADDEDCVAECGAECENVCRDLVCQDECEGEDDEDNEACLACIAECNIVDECEGEGEDDCESTPAPKLLVYNILPNGSVDDVAPPKQYCLPNIIEGVAFVDFGATPWTPLQPSSSTYLVLSHLNDGLMRLSATVAAAAYVEGTCPDDRWRAGDDPVPKLIGKQIIAESVKGSQDLALRDGRVWFANESGGRHLQLGDGDWPDLFPFVTYVDLIPSYFQE